MINGDLPPSSRQTLFTSGAALFVTWIPAEVDPDQTPDSPDDILTPSEMSGANTLAQQILVEMSRGRYTHDGAYETTRLAAMGVGATLGQFDDNDVFALDGDSRDADSSCATVDFGNNMNTYTVRTGEGSIVWESLTPLVPHIANPSTHHVSAITNTEDLGMPGRPAEQDGPARCQLRETQGRT